MRWRVHLLILYLPLVSGRVVDVRQSFSMFLNVLRETQSLSSSMFTTPPPNGVQPLFHA